MTDIRQGPQPDIYARFSQAYDRGRAQAQENGLAKLSQQYFTQGSSPELLGQVAALGGDAFALQKHDQDNQQAQAQETGRFAQMFLALPPEQKAQAYPALVAKVNALKLPHPPIPEQYNPQFDAGIAKFAEALGGGNGQAMGVQSSFIDAQGNRVAIMRDGTTQVLGQNAPNMRPIQGEGGIYGFDPRTNTAAPTMVGGPPQQAPQLQPGVQFDDATLQALMSVPASERPTMLAAMQADAKGQQVNLIPGPGGQPMPAPMPQGGAQLRPPSKPVSAGYTMLSPAEARAAGLAPGTVAQRGPDGKIDVISKPEVKNQSEATMRRNQSAADTSQATIDTIDRLTSSPGYKALGTVSGDIATHIPFVRTDAKDAQQQLDVLGGQIALSTMSSLKALSAQGATGFGALNREELKLLQNAVASLQAGGLSHAQLDKNIAVVREKMAKINEASVSAMDGATTPVTQQKPANPAHAGFKVLD